jgi:hypothetical protein
MKHKYYLLLWINPGAAVCFFLSSCYPASVSTDPYIVTESRQKENIYYIPSAPNVPLLTEKNDINFNVIRVSESKFSGFDIQAAYLPTKHAGVTGSYSVAHNGGGTPDYMKYNRFELGAGYVTQFSRSLHFETYAGIGSGKITNWHYTGHSLINLTHFFLQPAIAVNNKSKIVQLSFVSRFTGVSFNVKDTSFSTARELFSTGQIKGLYEDPFHVLWEPGLIFRAGWKNFLFHAGYSFSTDLTNPDLYRAKGIFSAGFSLRFNTTKREVTSK